MGQKDLNQEPRSGRTGMDSVKSVLRWVFKLRSVALAIPVAAIAVILAVRNMAGLPDEIVLGFGENLRTLSKSIAVLGPLALTALSLLMTFCSKRVVYPWIISLFTLVLPIVLHLTATFGI